MRKKFVSMVLSGIMVVSCALPVFASATIKRDNYTRQFESNWCWAATGKNFAVAINRNQSRPSLTKQKYELYSLIARNEGDTPKSESQVTQGDYNDYNFGGGLRNSCEIASLYDDSYDYDYKFGTMSYRLLMETLQNGYPYGLYLEDTSRTSKSSYVRDHIVLACGADDQFSDRVTIYDPAGNGTYVTLNYNDLKNGSSAFDYRAYSNTMYCDDQI